MVPQRLILDLGGGASLPIVSTVLIANRPWWCCQTIIEELKPAGLLRFRLHPPLRLCEDEAVQASKKMRKYGRLFDLMSFCPIIAISRCLFGRYSSPKFRQSFVCLRGRWIEPSVRGQSSQKSRTVHQWGKIFEHGAIWQNRTIPACCFFHPCMIVLNFIAFPQLLMHVDPSHTPRANGKGRNKNEWMQETVSISSHWADSRLLWVRN